MTNATDRAVETIAGIVAAERDCGNAAVDDRGQVVALCNERVCGCRSFSADIVAALDSAGLVIVPKVATKEMEHRASRENSGPFRNYPSIWASMIAAAGGENAP